MSSFKEKNTMKLKEKCEKLGAFIREFKERIANGEQPQMCRKFEGMLVEKLKPGMETQCDLAKAGGRAYKQFLVELGYDKALGDFWDESTVLWSYYDTWFDEVWYTYEDSKYDLGYVSWSTVKNRVMRNLGL